jgi:hypothetical protein
LLYEKLNAEMKEMVDRYATRLAPYTWYRRRELLSEAAGSFAEDLPEAQARVAAQGFVTAVLERWGDAEVTDPVQAEIYRASLNPEHRTLAEQYFAANPPLPADN